MKKIITYFGLLVWLTSGWGVALDKGRQKEMRAKAHERAFVTFQ